MRTIVAKEWRGLTRDGQLPVLALALAVLLLAAAITGASQTRRWQAETAEASAADIATFRAQSARNPHSVAHFGQYAFKPISPLAAFDPGVLPATGRGLWMEAHYQNTAELRAVDGGGSRLVLSPAWLLQLGLPLLVVLAGFGVWAAERESGTLRLQLVQGASVHRLLAGKAAALALLAVALWLPLTLWTVAIADDAGRAALLALAYGAYALVWVGFTLAASAWLREARAALALLLALWLATTLLVPRVAVDAGERLHPSPSSLAFYEAIKADQQKGIDGHNSEDARARQLLEDTLKQYGVSREEDLPISFAGISLQAGEDFGNRVHDHHFATLWQTYTAQDHTRLAFSAVSPLLPLAALSQAAAGSNWQHHRHFADAAEAHRRALQVFLNGDFTAHAKGQDFDYRADPALWAKTPVFDYQPPALAASGSPLWLPLGLLLLWLALAAGLAVAAARRLVRQGAA